MYVGWRDGVCQNETRSFYVTCVDRQSELREREREIERDRDRELISIICALHVI